MSMAGAAAAVCTLAGSVDMPLGINCNLLRSAAALVANLRSRAAVLTPVY